MPNDLPFPTSSLLASPYRSGRAKIKACVARGGVADRDAPNDPASTRYRCSLDMEEDETFESSMQVHMQAGIDPGHAFRAIEAPTAPQQVLGAQVSIPDPLAMVAEQLQSLNQSGSSAPATPAGTPAQGRG